MSSGISIKIGKSSINQLPKKRGRKPKIITSEGDKNKEDIQVGKSSINHLQKKRGRKPKIITSELDKNKEDIKKNQNIVLHLNITEDDLKTQDIYPQETNTLYHKYKEEVSLENNNKQQYIRYINDIIEERKNIITYNDILFLEFNNANQTKRWPSNTNIDCMWDGHSFENVPCGIPIKKVGKILYMFGNFCSPECAAAYNFSMNDDNIWERYSLINEIYSGNNDPINIANSKLLLIKFGGIYSINQYRQDNINTNYILNMPPVISYIPTIEEISKNYSKTELNKHLSINTDLNINRQNTILNNKNRLENIMNIKYI